MPKFRSRYVCGQCGADFHQYFGKCPACHQWNSLLEEAIAPSSSQRPSLGVALSPESGSKTKAKKHHRSPEHPVAALPIGAIADYPQARVPSGYGELDRVLGGGIVPGSLVLVGGHPGIGKSTLLLQAANQLAQRYRVLYVCAEESAQQVKLRSQRLGIQRLSRVPQSAPIPNFSDPDFSKSDFSESHFSESDFSEPDFSINAINGSLSSDPAPPNLYLLPETNLNPILLELESLRPLVAVVDSIQTLFCPALNSAPGSVSQVRECASALMQVAKRSDITLLIVGHVTKEGEIAGPKVLEHLVDTVLYFEGDRFARHRLLRSVKNRFGPTHEIGVFEMADQGLVEVPNPSALFLGNREEVVSGTATIVACEGTRPLVVEIQALVSPTSYSSPRRSTTGIEYNRLLQILAVLEKRVGIPLSKLDAYVAASGGLSVTEPAADLGVAIAVVASFRDRIIDPETVLIGEVGLGGQIRSVTQMDQRLREAAKLGFKRAIIPKGQDVGGTGLELIPVARVVDAIGVSLTHPSQVVVEAGSGS